MFRDKEKFQEMVRKREQAREERKNSESQGVTHTVLSHLVKENVEPEKFVPAVYSKKDSSSPEDATYIGRGSYFGNPYTALNDGGRQAAIKKYADYLFNNPELLEMVRKDLKGKDIICHCTPLPCHGDVLLLVANPELDFNKRFTDYKPDPVAEPVSDAYKLIKPLPEIEKTPNSVRRFKP